MRHLHSGLLTGILLLCSAVLCGAEELFLWKVTKPDTTGTLYLAGSVHMGKPDMYPLDSSYDQALADSGTIAFETLEPDAADMTRFVIAYGIYDPRDPDGMTLQKRMGEADFQKLAGLFREYEPKVSIPYLNRMRLWMAFLTLETAPFRKAGFTEQCGFEAVFRKHAGARKQIGLEEPVSQLEILIRPGMEEELLAYFHKMDVEKERKEIQFFTAHFFPLKTDVLLRSSRDMKEQTPKLYQALLIDRNRQFAEKLFALISGKDAETVFVVIGAAHFTGEENIRSLLEKKGCTVTHIPASGKPGTLKP